jgi:hypothetical protein
MVGYLFAIIAAIPIIFFIRLIMIDRRVVEYIKKNYPDYWQAHNWNFLLSGRGGPSVYKLAEDLNDPQIQNYEKQSYKALKQFLIAVVCIFLLWILLIFRFE